ncbi:MAG: toprim domain-containing protein [bacterium]
MIDTERLKTIDPEIILNTLGIQYKRTGSRLMATAEYRGEQSPSISIQEKNGRYLWLDFGTGKGGSWIDLIMAAKNIGYLEAVKFLNNIENDETINFRNKKDFSFGRQKETYVKTDGITYITDLNLINYLRSRAISRIPAWLKQISYTVFKGDKTYRNKALGIENSVGGYVVRNPRIKMNIGKSSHSLFTLDNKNELIFIVEGLFDGLTVAEKMRNRTYDLMILNSTENLNNKVIEVLSGYKFMIMGLDNDAAGINAENKITGRINNNQIYKLKFRANDLNESWVLKEKIEFARLK